MLGRLRDFLDAEAKPLLAEYWERGEFPDQLARPLIDLDLMEPAELTGAPVRRTPARGIYQGFRIFELARTDASLATLYTAQAGLFRTAIRVGASAEQQARVDAQGHRLLAQGRLLPDRTGVRFGHRRRAVHHRPRSRRRRTTGSWTAPSAGSAAPPPPTCWRCSPATSPTDRSRPSWWTAQAAGVTLEKIHGKTALRMMQNAHITLDGVRVPESMRLHNVNSFRDVAAMLRAMRSDVAWIATGIAGRRVRGGPALRRRAPAVRPPARAPSSWSRRSSPGCSATSPRPCPWWSG